MWWWALLPAGLLGGLLGVWVWSPAAYVRVVVSEQYREFQLAEMLTFAFALLGGVGLLIGAWRMRGGWGGGPWANGIAVVVLTGLAGVFFAGEEVNWGQTFLHWGVAEREQGRALDLNLHNTLRGERLGAWGWGWVPRVQVVGEIFVLAVFLGVPFVWAVRKRLPGVFPATWRADGWRAAVPPAGAVVAVLLGRAVAEWKDGYVRLHGRAADDGLYWGLIEQLNELKELMIATALLLFAASVLLRTQTSRSTLE